MRFPVTLILLFSINLFASAQDTLSKNSFDITRNTIEFPHPPAEWAFKISAGLAMVQPPKDLLENAIQAPLVNFHATFGFPVHISAEAQLTTILVSNQIMLGPRYNFLYKNFGIKAGWDVAYFYGQIRIDGFNNKMHAWVHYPNVSVGYKLQTIAFTVKGEMVIVAGTITHAGENAVDNSTNFINGGTLAFYIEQRIHKNKVMTIGLKDNYLKWYWPTWMIFTTFNRLYHIPELSFNWIL